MFFLFWPYKVTNPQGQSCVIDWKLVDFHRCHESGRGYKLGGVALFHIRGTRIRSRPSPPSGPTRPQRVRIGWPGERRGTQAAICQFHTLKPAEMRAPRGAADPRAPAGEWRSIWTSALSPLGSGPCPLAPQTARGATRWRELRLSQQAEGRGQKCGESPTKEATGTPEPQVRSAAFQLSKCESLQGTRLLSVQSPR